MKEKKSKQANLESKRPTLLLLGLIFSLGITLESFEWLKSDVVLKPVSSLEDENLTEPINEVMIIKPTPKMNRSFNQPKRSTKGPVIVEEKPVVIFKDPSILPVDPNPKPIEPFNLNNDLPTEPNEPVNLPEIDQLDFAAVQEKPEFIGGQKAMMEFISKNIVYPSISKRKGKQGKVYVSFIIDEKGNVANVEIVKGVDKHLDIETVRVINKMPQWKPGKQRGRLVKVKYTIPVNYKLRD